MKKQAEKSSGNIPSLDNPSNKTNLIFLGLLSLIFLIAYSYIFDKKLDLNGDNFAYLNYARSIMNGDGYTSPLSPDHPASNWFPPGYSALLALLMTFFGENVVLLKIVNGLLYLGGIILLMYVMKKAGGNTYLAFSVSALLLLNSGLLRYATIIMSEIPYLFLSVLALYFLFKMKDDEKLFKSKYFYGVLLASVAAFYFRSIGVVLAGAIILFWLIEKKWKRVLTYGVGYIILYLPWMIRNSTLGLKSRYFDTMTVVNNWRPEEGHINTISGFLDKMVTNFYDTVIKGFTDVLFPFANVDAKSQTVVMLLGIVVLIITFYGAWKTGRFRYLFCSYILGNILVFLVWHPGNGSRYVWPLAPFIAFCFFLGLYYFVRKLVKADKKPDSGKWAYALLLFSLLYVQSLDLLNKMAKADYMPAYKNYFEIAKAINKQGDRNIVVSCRKADMFYYFSKTYTNMYLFSEDDKAVIGQMVKSNVDFVVLEQLGYGSTGRYLYPAIMKNQELFRVAMHLPDPDTYLLWFDKNGAAKKLGLAK